MNLKLILRMALMCACCFTACKKDDTNTTPEQPGQATPVGTLTGTPVSKAIGPEGGALTSEDGSLSVNIPAGALNSTQTITIQPITNESGEGFHQSYRITPHNLQMAQPASITFNYTAEALNGSAAEVLGIAYQKADGIWMSIDDVQLDKASNKLTVNTTHFSDWTLFQKLYIVPKAPLVVTGGEVPLKVKYQVNKVNANKGEQPIIYAVDVPKKVTKRWRLSGEGSLISRAAEAWYTAPMEVPAENPVAVTAEIDYGQQAALMLVCNIKILQPGFHITVGAGPGAGIYSMTGPSQAIYRRNTQTTQITCYGENTGGVNRHIELVFPGKGDGSPYAWEWLKPIEMTLQININGAITVYHSTWSDDRQWHDSPGSIVINKYGNEGEYVAGSFTSSKSGYKDGGRTACLVSGTFLVLNEGESSN
ncbi:hypothetical protein MKQ68_08870 [Chitinophaga horti]|uniref:ZU5 domain-containing protein n=1 Tax=Chitinophaga horti TaxID=2920382 RepID=A0ABY6J767_9BACT|nr:hypothetical protein [Chitinophaga horti]UYQ95206.1 hypothetical protein MKQ68_08870 [Chitinophaga horti]